jgi:CheY-like chemotaxis protein
MTLANHLCPMILVVEDDSAIREVLTDVLESEGYQVVNAANGREAIQLLRGTTLPCLILLDLMMPVMNGWQFRDEQRQDPVLAPVPVVVISADSDLPTKAAAIHANDFLKKPIELNRLLDTVEQYCG